MRFPIQETDESYPLVDKEENIKSKQNEQRFVANVATYNRFNNLRDDDETDDEILDITFFEDQTNIHYEKENKPNTRRQKKNENRRCKTRSKKNTSKNKQGPKKSPIKTKETALDKATVLKRCHGCHLDHMPLPKFCRWWEERRNERKESMTETEELSTEKIVLVKNCIETLEHKFSENSEMEMSKHELIVNNFLKRSEDSCNSEEFKDIFSFKLRGGGDKRHKVCIISNNTILDCVLSFFRDMVPLWHEIDSHELCNHKLEPRCFYCL